MQYTEATNVIFRKAAGKQKHFFCEFLKVPAVAKKNQTTTSALAGIEERGTSWARQNDTLKDR